MKIKGVIFDMDGLMVDTERIALETTIQTHKEQGYIMPRDLALSLIGMNVEAGLELLRGYFGASYPAKEIRARTVAKRYAYYQQHPIKKKAGLDKLLVYLKKQGYLLGVASSTRLARVEEILNQLNLLDYFTVVVGGDQIVNSKPEPDIFLVAGEKLGLPAENILILEDSKNGIIAANRAQMAVICIPDLVEHDDRIKRLCLAVLTDLEEVIGYLEENN